jgi:hypothetical protein
MVARRGAQTPSGDHPFAARRGKGDDLGDFSAPVCDDDFFAPSRRCYRTGWILTQFTDPD